MFGDIEIEKRRFLHCKNLILLKDVDIKRIQVSSMVSSGKKKIINISLVIEMMITELNNYTQCFQKQLLM